MKWHPASMMLATWAACFALLFILPFHLVGRELTGFGLAMLGGSILAFCIGAWLRSTGIAQMRPATQVLPNFDRADAVMAVASIIGMLALLVEWWGNAGSLSSAWDLRSDRTTALLTGSDSGSSILFQIGFLFAPVGYVVIAREAIFSEKVRVLRLTLLGFGPLLLSALALGGRGPLLWGFTIMGLSLLAKGWVIAVKKPSIKQKASARSIVLGAVGVIAMLAALNYFVEVFVIRAEASGGIETVFDSVADNWGVTFDGDRAEFLKSTLGIGNTYLIFVFAWYLVQGIVISNTLFTYYTGAAQLGLSGIEIFSAIARRISPGYIESKNIELYDLNVFGFLPSAFGTLFLDYRYFCLLVAAIWGYIASIVYVRVRTDSDTRWVLVAPFVMHGIFTSLINTPLGATNGFIMLAWLIAVFAMAKPRLSPSSTARPHR